MIHNRYLFRGGEDESADMEAALLREHGHSVDLFEMDNRVISRRTLLKTSIDSVWSRAAHRAVVERLGASDFDLVHVQNFFPLFSPSVHHASKSRGKPVVQSLHNYRLLCVNGLLFRSGRVCEDCVSKYVPWPGVLHGCYRDSTAGSAVVATMLMTHRVLRTWSRMVDGYIVYSEFARDKFMQAGLPRERMTVKPSFVHPDPGAGSARKDFVLSVGRLTGDKGIPVLLEAWRRLKIQVPLTIVGDGPLEEEVRESAATIPGIQYLGRLPLSEVYDLMGQARLLIFPSRMYENSPRVVIEAFAKGTPVLASGIGAARELVDAGRTGLHFSSGDASDLCGRIEWAWKHPEECRQMGLAARREFELKFTPETNYGLLMEAYEAAMARNRSRQA